MQGIEDIIESLLFVVVRVVSWWGGVVNLELYTNFHGRADFSGWQKGRRTELYKRGDRHGDLHVCLRACTIFLVVWH